MTVEAGKAVNLNLKTFGLSDPDGTLDNTVITLVHGGAYLIKIANEESYDSSFTYEELKSGKVSLTLIDRLHAPNLELLVRGNDWPTSQSHLLVQLKDRSVITTNGPIITDAETPLALKWQAETVLDESFFSLDGSAAGAIPAGLLFKAAAVKGGSFRVNGQDKASLFTLQDLRDGLVSFVHDGKSTSPSFTLGLVDAAGKAAATPLVLNAIPFAADMDIAEDQMTTLDLPSNLAGIALNYIVKTQGSKGQAEIHGHTLTYTPQVNAFGDDSLVLEIRDGKGGIVLRPLRVAIASSEERPEVIVSGPAKVGGLLSAVANFADDEGFGPISYVWQDASGQILGEGASYILKQTDLGKKVKAVASYTQGDTETSRDSEWTTPLSHAMDVRVGRFDGNSPVVAALKDGGWVVTWSGNHYEVWDSGVIQQRYNAQGAPIGVPKLVNSSIDGDQVNPCVTGLADGGWLVAWESPDEIYSWAHDIYQQRYDASGTRVGPETRVNTHTEDGQAAASVTALADNGWVVSWQSRNQDGSGWKLYQQRYDAKGNPIGDETRINTSTERESIAPSVTTLADGGWLVTWQFGQESGALGDIYQQRYTSSGVKTGGEVRVESQAEGKQWNPDVTALADGGWLVTWVSQTSADFNTDIFQQRYSHDGAKVGIETRVSSSTTWHQGDPDVTALKDGGWVVTWQSELGNGGLYLQRFNSSGAKVGGETLVNEERSPFPKASLTALPDGGWVVTWDTFGLYQKRFSAAGVPEGNWGPNHEANWNALKIKDSTPGDAPKSGDQLSLESDLYSTLDIDGLGELEYQWRRDGQNIEGATSSFYIVTEADAGHDLTYAIHFTDGHGYEESFVRENPVHINYIPTGAVSFSGTLRQGQELRASHSLADLDGLGNVTYIWKADGVEFATGQAVTLRSAQFGHKVTVTANYLDGAGNSEAVSSTESVPVQGLAFGETRVNGAGNGTPASSEVISLADGGWLIVWHLSGQPDQIYQQRYSTDGFSIGQQARVDTGYSYDLEHPAATAMADGGWLITWQVASIDEQHLYRTDIFQKRFAADGSALDDASLVNSLSPRSNTDPNVTALDDGGWLVTWQSGNDIHQQRFSAAGLRLGEVSLVNTVSPDSPEYQSEACVTTLEDGGWLVTWQSGNLYFEGADIYQQRFAADGARIGAETLVNTSLDGKQLSPEVSALVDGGWLVTWQSGDNYAEDADIYQQRYDAVGQRFGEEIHVNTTKLKSQNSSTVTALSDGGWVVTWDSNQIAWNERGIYQQRFDASGNRIGSETLVNTSGTYSHSPAITALADGGWLVSWDQGDIYQQRFNADGSPVGGWSANHLPVAAALSVSDSTPLTPAHEGDRLNAILGAGLDPDGLGRDLSYQWLRDGLAIEGSTESSYLVTAADVAHSLSYTLSYTDGRGRLESVTLPSVVRVTTSRTDWVQIEGRAIQGETLTATHNLGSQVIGVSYTWKADGVSFAWGSSTKLPPSAVDKKISVEVSYYDETYHPQTVISAATLAVQNLNDSPTGSIYMFAAGSGSDSALPYPGQVLMASGSIWDEDGLGDITYHWLAGKTEFATGSSVTLGTAQMGKSIKLVATYTDLHGTAERVESAASAAVNPKNKPIPFSFSFMPIKVTEGQALQLDAKWLKLAGPSEGVYFYASAENGSFLNGTETTGFFSVADLTAGKISFESYLGSWEEPRFSITGYNSHGDSFHAESDAKTLAFTPYLTLSQISVIENKPLKLSTSWLKLAGSSEGVIFHVNAENGQFIKERETTDSFDWNELNAGKISFEQLGGNLDLPRFSIMAYLPNGESFRAQSNAETLVFKAVNDKPELSTWFVVDEGGTMNLHDVLWLRDEEDEAAGVLEQAVYTAKATGGQFLKNGVAVKSFTHGDVLNGSVVFVHDGGDKPPVIELEVKDSGKAITRLILKDIPFNPVNDPITIKPTLLTLEAGKTLKLSSKTFGLIDPDGDLARALITLEHDGEYLVQVAGRERPDGHFSGAELLRGQVSLTLVSLKQAPALSLRVHDEGGAETHRQVPVLLKSSKVPSLAPGDLPLELLRNGETLLKEAHFKLGGSLFGNPPEDIVFTASAVKGGSFRVAGQGPSTSFTLDDLREGRVSFVHDGLTPSPSFNLGLVDAAAKAAKILTLKALPFILHVDAVEDLPMSLALPAHDAKGHDLEYRVKSQGEYGVALIQGDQLIYVPYSDANGKDQLVLEVRNAKGVYSLRSIDITIASSSEAPALAFSGTSQIGSTLRAAANVADDEGLSPITVVWQDANGNVLSYGNTYFLQSADLGRQIQATAHYTDASDQMQQISSSWTSAVSEAPAEIHAHPNTEGHQGRPSLAALKGGGWLPVWQTWATENGGILLQRFDQNGQTLGDQIFVDFAIYNSLAALEIIPLLDGGWLLSWRSTAHGSFLQRFDAEGVAMGELRSDFRNPVDLPRFAALPDGGWLEVEMDYSTVLQKRFNLQGSQIGEAVQVNSSVYREDLLDPQVTLLQDGGWLVSWIFTYQEQSGLVQQRFGVKGNPIDKIILSPSSGSVNSHQVSALPDGGWLLVWEASGGDAVDSDIFQQRFAADGWAMTKASRINSTLPGSQIAPEVSPLKDGGWVITWRSMENEQDGIYQQRFDASGSALGGETSVNSLSAYEHSVIALPDGGWLVATQAWNGLEMDIYQKRFAADGQPLGGWGVNHEMTLQITGEAHPGQVLHATASDSDGLGPVFWQWLRDNQVIDGAREASYTVQESDLNHQISIQGVTIDGHGQVENSRSDSVHIRPPNQLPNGGVYISGSAAEDQILNASHDITDADGLGAVRFSWLADNISFAEGESITLGQAQVGKVIKLVASYIDGWGYFETLHSEASLAIKNVDDAPSGRPFIASSTSLQNFVNSTPSAIPEDQSLLLSSLLVDAEMQVLDVNVFLDISHTWLGDLSATLIAPDGTRVPLFAEVGGSGDDFTGTRFDAQSNLMIAQGSAPFSDSYRPLGDLSSLNGRNAAGTWSLELHDSYPSDAGILQSWGLQITGFDNAAGHLSTGQVLHAVNSLSDEDGLGPISYSWRANGIEFSTSVSVQLGAAQVGSELSLVASYIDGFGHAESISNSGGIVMPIAEIVVS